MPRLTMPAAMIASARMPGSRKLIALPFTAGAILSEVKKISSSTGTINVTSTFSPRRSVSSSSHAVCTPICRNGEAAFLLAAVDDALAVMGGVRAMLFPPHFGSGEPQEEIFQRAMADPQLRERRLLIAQPCRQLGQQLWYHLCCSGLDQVAAGAHL